MRTTLLHTLRAHPCAAALPGWCTSAQGVQRRAVPRAARRAAPQAGGASGKMAGRQHGAALCQAPPSDCGDSPCCLQHLHGWRRAGCEGLEHRRQQRRRRQARPRPADGAAARRAVVRAGSRGERTCCRQTAQLPPSAASCTNRLRLGGAAQKGSSRKQPANDSRDEARFACSCSGSCPAVALPARPCSSTLGLSMNELHWKRARRGLSRHSARVKRADQSRCGRTSAGGSKRSSWIQQLRRPVQQMVQYEQTTHTAKKDSKRGTLCMRSREGEVCRSTAAARTVQPCVELSVR